MGLSGGVSTLSCSSCADLYANCDTSDEEEEDDDNDEEAARRVATEQSRNLTLTPGVFREELEALTTLVVGPSLLRNAAPPRLS